VSTPNDGAGHRCAIGGAASASHFLHRHCDGNRERHLGVERLYPGRPNPAERASSTCVASRIAIAITASTAIPAFAAAFSTEVCPTPALMTVSGEAPCRHRAGVRQT